MFQPRVYLFVFRKISNVCDRYDYLFNCTLLRKIRCVGSPRVFWGYFVWKIYSIDPFSIVLTHRLSPFFPPPQLVQRFYTHNAFKINNMYVKNNDNKMYRIKKTAVRRVTWHWRYKIILRATDGKEDRARV